MMKKQKWCKWCLILAVALVVPAVHADLDLTTATTDASSVGWGLGPNLCFDDNLATRNSTYAHLLPPDAAATSTNEWLWVDLGSDLQLASVAVDFQNSASVDYTIRLLTEAQGTTLGLIADGTAGGGVSNWTTIATATGLPNAVEGAAADGTRHLAGTADVWDFTAGTSVIPDNTTGTATVDVLNPTGRYLLIDSTLVSDITWGNVSIWEVDVNAIPEPATLALLATGGLAMLRRRRS